MAERVKQHYVPQFYFRNFAENERVCAYNIDNEEGYPPTPISNICYENHFYGDSDVEEILSKLESELANVVHTVVKGQSLNDISSDSNSKFYLDLFLTHTYSRTKAAREESSELTQEFLELMTKVGVEAGELDKDVLEQVRNGDIRLKGPDHAQRQLASLYGPIYFSDLDRVLIRNHTSLDFITSDHPVVFDNRRFKDEVELGTTGFSSMGLQVFCPLSNSLLILLYDPESYLIEANEQNIVDTDSERMVEGLNKLQLLNCLENCYYRNETDKELVDEWYQDIREHRPHKSITRQNLDLYDPEEDRIRNIIATHNTKVEYSPWLPFVKQRCSAEFRPVRNQHTYQVARKMYDEAIETAESELEENEEDV